MKNLNVILFILITLMAMSCSQNEKVAPTDNVSRLKSWETVIDGNSFSSYTAFDSSWNYLYPWGSTHNGSARMVGSSTDHSYIYLESGNVLVCKSEPVSGQGTIHYYSGTVYAKTKVLVNDQYPNWEVKGDFQCSSVKGTWPAFWLTGAWTWPPESDIMEFKGNSNCWQNTFRTSSDVSSQVTAVSSPGSWHNYRVWISKTDSVNINIHYYIDGVWKAVHKANFVGKPMWIIIDYQMEGSSGTPGPTYTTYLKAKNIYVGRTKAY
ncbi:MAG: glycoside hydrolase [Bacteroidota bacterium]|nr:glycoside hydrolase [Bacteroidota bacterium]